MTRAIRELDLVELKEDMPSGLVGGARGVAVALHGDTCTVEYVDADGLTIGLFEIPLSKLDRAEPMSLGASIAREE